MPENLRGCFQGGLFMSPLPEKKDPFRKTPWLGRIVFAVLGKLVAVILALIFRNTVLPGLTVRMILAFATLMTITAIIFMGRVGETVPGKCRIFSMIGLTHVLILFNRILPDIWQSNILSTDILASAGMLGLAFMQIPNIFRAIEMRRAENVIYRQRRMADACSFHRYS